MDPQDILRFVDIVYRERGIDKEIVFVSIEQGLLTAARKRFGEDAVLEVHLDRKSGEVRCLKDGQAEPLEFGRIAAQTARQVMNQRIREAERDKNLDEYNRRVSTIVTGSIQRIEGGNLIVNLGRVEGIVPRSEQIRGENYKVGDRIRAYLFEVRPQGQRVRIVLSRAHADFVRKLFELEVPEVGEGMIQIKSLVREAGYKTKLAVVSTDSKVDPIGACVGVRGSRIRNGHRRAQRREDRHPQVGGAARGHDRDGPQAGPDQRPHAELRHEDRGRPRRGGPALPRHRPSRRQRAPRLPPVRLGHPDRRREAHRGPRRRRCGPRRSRRAALDGTDAEFPGPTAAEDAPADRAPVDGDEPPPRGGGCSGALLTVPFAVSRAVGPSTPNSRRIPIAAPTFAAQVPLPRRSASTRSRPVPGVRLPQALI